MNRQLYIFSFFLKTFAHLLFFGEIWKEIGKKTTFL